MSCAWEETYQAVGVVAECHDCGERKPCTRFTALWREAETGYLDEFDICEECAEKKGKTQ